MGASFVAGEGQWRARLESLRQVVRQELVARQLAAHIADAPPRRILDVGCGQGTQLLRLARRGHQVTGLDSSSTLLADLERALLAEDPALHQRVRLVHADAEGLLDQFAPASFDVVLCHGVLMYFADPDLLLDALAALVTPGGLVSLLVRNGDALAMRPGLLGDWAAVTAAFEGGAYLNRLGVQARADRLEDLTARLAARRLAMLTWYGVRVFTDGAADDAPTPDPDELSMALACEERAGWTDPYRRVAALLHIIATLSSTES
jgi:S-adenosylmethionine-dependent methyltransferase